MYTVYTRILGASAHHSPSLIAATERHPYILMPIGLTEQKKQISAMIDTGAGLNIGLLSYWQDFADKFPHLVKAFGPIDFSRYEKVIVGSVNKAAEGTVCTHFINPGSPKNRP